MIISLHARAPRKIHAAVHDEEVVFREKCRCRLLRELSNLTVRSGDCLAAHPNSPTTPTPRRRMLLSPRCPPPRDPTGQGRVSSRPCTKLALPRRSLAVLAELSVSNRRESPAHAHPPPRASCSECPCEGGLSSHPPPRRSMHDGRVGGSASVWSSGGPASEVARGARGSRSAGAVVGAAQRRSRTLLARVPSGCPRRALGEKRVGGQGCTLMARLAVWLLHIAARGVT